MINNIELLWDIVCGINQIVIIVITAYLFYRFVKPYIEKSKSAVMIGVVYLCAIITLYVGYGVFHLDGSRASGIAASVTFAAMCFFDRRNFRQKVFLAMTMYMIEWIAGGIAGIIIVYLYDLVIMRPYMMQRPILKLCMYILISIADIVLNYAVMACLFRIVNKSYISKREDMSSRELGLMIATPLLVLSGNVILVFISEAYLEDMNQYIWHLHPEYKWIRIIYQLISFAAIMTSIVIYQRIKEGHKKEKENALLAEQIKYTKSHIKEVERMYRDIRGLRHDMGNHVTILENLFLKNEPQETEKYFLRLKEQLREITLSATSGNPVTDVILAEIQKKAEEKNIQFLCDFHYPQGTDIDAFDVSVILNNALDNAMEGAVKSENPYVKICSYQKKNVYMIEIKNSIAKMLEINEESGLPDTTKADQERHGLGLANIRKVAQKYMGDIDIEQKEHEFMLSVMMMVR